MSPLVLALLVLPVSLPAQTPDPRPVLEALRESPHRSPTGEPLFPADLRIEAGPDGALVLSGTFRTPADPRMAEVVEELRLETVMGALDAAEAGGVRVLLREGARVRPLGGERRTPRVRQDRPPRLPPRPSPKLPLGGALLGKRIALSAGHGWLESTTSPGTWATQRVRWDFEGCGSCRGITEDFFNADVIAFHVIPLLQGMGAEVVLVRNPDHSTEPMVVVDDGDAAYAESGTWAAGTNTGGHGGDYRASPPGGGEATFSLATGAAGRRNVALRWLEGGNRTVAQASVRHAGGTTTFDLDQQRFGRFWLDLGSFWFDPTGGSLTLSNPGSGYLIADAALAGGGTFTPASKPWWQMAALSYVPWAGASADVLQYGDVSIRPAYAEYVGADLYLSFHGNASGSAGASTVNGLSTYRYSCQTYSDHSSSDSATGCDDPPGSKAALDLIHAAMLARVRADWDPNFRNRGKYVANFGELRTLEGIPGVLIESAFFDNRANPSGTPPPKYADNRTMHDPRWREALAYGIAEGVAQYLNPGSHAPPVRPEGLRAVNRADGTLEVSWRAVPGAAGYRLYTVAGPHVGLGRERAFDAGRFVTASSAVLSDLTARTVYGFRVTAVSANGEGLPSQTVVARFRGANTRGRPVAEALVVSAYDRRDAWVQEVDNDGAYAIEHGQAMAAASGADVFFDGVLDEAVEDGSVLLAGYRLVDLATGKDSVEHESVSKAMQALLTPYLAAGGALMVSGEEVGYDLAGKGDATDQAFFSDQLRASYVADDADAFTFTGAAAGPFDGVGTLGLDDGTKGVFRVEYPDVLSPATGASVALTWPDGRAAAVSSAQVVLFGFPLEAVVPGADRAKLFSRAVAHLAPGIAQGDLDLDGAFDACEVQYGFDPHDAVDGPQDADGDGKSNAQECQAGTDPGRGPGLGADAGFPFPDAAAPASDASGPGTDASTAGPDAQGAPGEDAGPVPGLDAAAPGVDAARQVDATASAGDVGSVPVEDGGCGCAAGPGAAGWGWLPAALWGLARRRRSLQG